MLHDDALSVEELGRARCWRASHVEHDEDRQLWVVTDAKSGEEIFAHPSRQECLRAERRHFSSRMGASGIPGLIEGGG